MPNLEIKTVYNYKRSSFYVFVFLNKVLFQQVVLQYLVLVLVSSLVATCWSALVSGQKVPYRWSWLSI